MKNGILELHKRHKNSWAKQTKQQNRFLYDFLKEDKLFNDSIEKSEFSQNLKLVDITSVYKNNDPLGNTNYRTVGVLPVVLKIFERIMQKN